MTDSINDYISSDRHDFDKGKLDLSNIEQDPFMLFKKWLQEALDKTTMEPYAFNLSTVVDSKPTSRVVYLRLMEKDGYVFFTNYNGRKGKDISNNHHVCMNFFWPELEKQVRIEGVAEQINPKNSDAYFESRPRESQLGAWASHQSDELKSMDELHKRLAYYTTKFENKPIPRPEYWGGYIIKPTYFEFWQGRPSRLHDRFAFTLIDNKWCIKRLNP